MRRAAVMLLTLALAVGLAGCGGEESETATPETVVGTLPEAPEETTDTGTEAPEVEGNAEDGEAVFASSGCGSCHTLEAAGSEGNVGPNLNDAAPEFDEVYTIVTNGRGAMPAFEDQLSEQQIADVAQYVSEST
jgi:mono/diheme cytochrome c family protein